MVNPDNGMVYLIPSFTEEILRMTDSEFQDIRNVLSLQSSVYSEYFNSLMRNQNIKTIRHGVTILMIYFYCDVDVQRVLCTAQIYKLIESFDISFDVKVLLKDATKSMLLEPYNLHYSPPAG